MNAYFEYLRELIVRIWNDFVRFMSKRVVSPWLDVGGNFAYYHELLMSAKGDFHFWGWFFYVLMWILFAALLVGINYGLYRLIRKYVRFHKTEMDKEKLREQVDDLNLQLYEAVQERDKILNLKSAYMGLSVDGAKKEKEEAAPMNTRFPKLTYVDEQYKKIDTSLTEIPGLSLEQLSNAFRNYAASSLGLYYSIDTIRQLFAGMATSKLIILEGISGTGKTSLAYAVGKFFRFDSAIIPVQPSWKDRTDLLGYYNEFTKKFNETEFLKALYTATYRNETDVIVLDEMNLARIEYYFAEFLSVMEMRDPNDWLLDLIPAPDPTDPKHVKDGKILVPQNVIFFGTANNDDSTFTISDKVYDRAISLFFDDKGRPFDSEKQEPMAVPYTQLRHLYDEAVKQYPVSQGMVQKFAMLDDFIIHKFRLAFGNRILKQLETFIPVYVASGGTEIDGYDFIFTNKILKKFESLNIGFLKDQLGELEQELDRLYGKNTFPRAHRYIEVLLETH